jgi:hypothetical protein
MLNGRSDFDPRQIEHVSGGSDEYSGWITTAMPIEGRAGVVAAERYVVPKLPSLTPTVANRPVKFAALWLIRLPDTLAFASNYARS